jgi:CelD/BcsL family acetyltransferase involved in cellulose biosynthesis
LARVIKLSLPSQGEMAQWDDFVNSHAEGTPFHLSCWLKTIGNTYPYEPLLYALQDETAGLSGVLPAFLLRSIFKGSRLISLPFSDYCYPLVQSEDGQRQMLSYILNELNDKIRYMEIRGPLKIPSSFSGHVSYKRHAIKLCSDFGEVKKNINKRTIQYCVRKAEKEGIEIKEDNSKNGLETFYWLNQLTRKKHGVPAQPKMFFRNLYENIVGKGYGSIYIARLRSKAIAAGFFLRHKKTVYYKYNASNPEFMKRYSPNHLLTWRAIEQACRDGFHLFDFGRSSSNNPGLIRYKEMWGAISSDLPYFYFPPQYQEVAAKMESGFLYRISTLCWRLMPSSLASKLGPLIYKHLG